MSSSLPLTIGYSTLANRAKNIKFLTSVNNLVIVQNPEGSVTPTFSSKVKVLELQSKGVAKSRNAAILNTNTEYLIFGDDDIEEMKKQVEAENAAGGDSNEEDDI